MPRKILLSKISESAVKRRKRYVDNMKDITKPTCLIRGSVNSSYKRNVLGEFGTKYDKYRPTKEHRQDPATKKRFGIQHKKNSTTQYAVDEIILQENEK